MAVYKPLTPLADLKKKNWHARFYHRTLTPTPQSDIVPTGYGTFPLTTDQ
jgi:hypothetical protein